MKFKDYVKEIYDSKGLKRMLWIICFILLVFFYTRYKEYYEVVSDYNYGVKMLKEGQYSSAESLFQAALWDKHTKRQECKIRINYALAIVKPITPESVTPENIDEKIERLEEAISILTENDCAHMNDSNGHSRKAQRLKEEIEDYIEQLKKQAEEQKEQQSKESDQNKENDQDQDKDKKEEEQRLKEEQERKAKEKEDEIRNLMENATDEGMMERTQDLDIYDSDGSMSYSYDDRCW